MCLFSDTSQLKKAFLNYPKEIEPRSAAMEEKLIFITFCFSVTKVQVSRGDFWLTLIY